MFCGKCGAEIPDGYEFCMKCGSKIDLTQKNNVEVPKKKSKKWLIPVIAVVVIIVIAIVAIYFVKDMQKKSGLYNNIAWGTSFENVKAIVDKENGDEKVEASDDKSLVFEQVDNYKGDSGVSATVIYDCKSDDTLHSVQLFISNGDDSKYTDSQLYDKYEKEFTDLYGESGNDTLGMTWKTEKSKIKLIHLGENAYIIEYEDINTVDD